MAGAQGPSNSRNAHLGLHIELDQLKYEATEYFTLTTTYISGCLSFLFGAVDADLSKMLLDFHDKTDSHKHYKMVHMQELVDVDIFLDARKVVEALRNRDCSEALMWCTENKSKLKKSKVLQVPS